MYHCFRLHRGEDLYESIQRYADAHHIAAGVVLSAVGCVYRWELRDASGVDVQSGTEDVEIVSLMGTVSEHGSHLHASLAHRDLSVFGGHLRPGCLVNPRRRSSSPSCRTPSLPASATRRPATRSWRSGELIDNSN